MSASVVGSMIPPPAPVIAWPSQSTCSAPRPSIVLASAAIVAPTTVSAMPIR